MGKVKFGVFTDVHLDIMHDGEQRVRTFLDAAEREKADFIIQLGDMRYPDQLTPPLCKPENTPVNLQSALIRPTPVDKGKVVRMFNAFRRPALHLLGNHDMDFASKEQAMALMGMECPYYSFDAGAWHFVALDTNYYRDESGAYIEYNHGNYLDHEDLPYLPPEQLAWLEADLAAAKRPTVIFSHQPLAGQERSVRNQAGIRAVMREAKKAGSPVRLCMNGHLHKDILLEAEGVHYLTVNSISSFWAGPGHCTRRYDEALENTFPCLKYSAPYDRPLYAFVELEEDGRITIQGTAGAFVPPAPHINTALAPLSACISNRLLV